MTIIKQICERRVINLPWKEIATQALQWERHQNGRSGRTAIQFIDHLEGELGLTNLQAKTL